MAGYILLRVLAVVLLVAANAFFVASEFALVSVRDTRIQQLVNLRRIGARTVQKLHDRMDELLSAVQLGVTLASLGLGWVGEATLADIIHSGIAAIPHARLYAHGIAIVIAFILITFFHVVLGEVVPKSVALQRADRVALAVAGPMDFFMTVARPFLAVIASATRGVLRLFGTPQIRAGGVHSPEELKLIVTAAQRLGLVPKLEEEMILRALELNDITVRQVMVPRPRIFSLPADMPLEQALARVVEEQHSRIPVYDPLRGPEYIVGLLYSKDLTRWMRQRYTTPAGDPAAARPAQMTVRDIMHHALMVPETKPLPDLLVELRRRKRHMAVVVDEFGTTAGVVTVEDVLEQIVGEIEDEFDVPPPAMPAATGGMVLDGAVNIRDLETQYNLVLPSDQGFETLGGFMMAKLQRIPKPGDYFDFQGRRFTVLDMEGRRIARVLVEVTKPKAVQRAGD